MPHPRRFLAGQKVRRGSGRRSLRRCTRHGSAGIPIRPTLSGALPASPTQFAASRGHSILVGIEKPIAKSPTSRRRDAGIVQINYRSLLSFDTGSLFVHGDCEITAILSGALLYGQSRNFPAGVDTACGL